MNINRPLVVAAFVALVVAGCSQPSDLISPSLEPQFGTAASDGAYAVAKHSTGVYVVGSTSGNLHGTNKGGSDAYIRKVTTSGGLVWGRQFGTSKPDSALDVTIDAGGNAYVLGRTGGSLARALRGRTDLFLRKYTPSGTVAWTKQMGLDTDDDPGGVAVSGSSVYVVGTSEGFGTFIYRFNLSGGTIWKKRFSTFDSRDVAIDGGGHGDVAVDDGGNVYVAGTVTGTCEYPEYESDCTNVQMNKYNASGNLVWIKRLSLAQKDRLQAITANGSSLYLVEQTFDVPDNHSYTLLVKLDTSGVIQWSEYVGVAYAYDGPVLSRSDNVSADGSGAYVASTAITNFGDPNDPAGERQVYEVTKFTADGLEAWRLGAINCCYGGGNDMIFGSVSGVLARGGGELYIAGTVGSAGRSNDAYLKRLNAATGSTVWTR